MLWKYYKDDPEVCSYMFGTMHMSTKEAYSFVDLAKKYIQSVSAYMAEMDLNLADNTNLLQHFMLADDERFSDLFRPKQYQRYRKILLKIFQIDLKNYDNFSPFFIINFLAELSLAKDNPVPLDHCLWSFAMSQGKEMSGIETLDDQLLILANIPRDFQIKSFKDALKNLPSFRQKIKTINHLYGDGDIQRLYKISKKSMGKIRKMMIYDRNERMTTKAIDLHEQKPCFTAVGAAHLGGKKGILALLKKRGYKIRQIKH